MFSSFFVLFSALKQMLQIVWKVLWYRRWEFWRVFFANINVYNKRLSVYRHRSSVYRKCSSVGNKRSSVYRKCLSICCKRLSISNKRSSVYRKRSSICYKRSSVDNKHLCSTKISLNVIELCSSRTRRNSSVTLFYFWQTGLYSRGIRFCLSKIKLLPKWTEFCLPQTQFPNNN